MAGRPGSTKRMGVRWARRLAVAAGLASFLTLRAHDAPAQDPVAAAHDLQSADDFRLRVSAALILGRSHAVGALGLLEQALSDVHPAVRTAAAAALVALGDRSAIPVLQQKLVTETSAAARTQMVSAITALRALGSPERGDTQWENTRYVVAIGDMHNRSAIAGDHASDVLRSATRSHARSIPGALVSDGPDSPLLRQAASRHVPVFLLDGALQRLARGQSNAQLSYNAQVDYSLRRVPEHQLRGMLTGSATSFGSVSALLDPGTMTELEDQAIDGAVESALRGAARGFGEALR